ncbi:DUF4865 domain-containing protein [Streptacidiphilus pinicola]|uniref:DUF4865 domain-containing protein n=1 Tax=Streptacidiphilus pinicola TaxID=2219663 RepID=A0A2X0IQK8_9ACTN|nr:DUF4865 family protein [Streptacidiphilus pinicola]RAG87494.1 DUF4865 domain-containing protein [Streptacidiphilus pinicola]
MFAMQYPITLPSDYDMEILRKRVQAASSMLDDRAGLGFKAYLLRERGVAGSSVNEYAPFYVWRDPAAAADFLLRGGGFQNIIRSFGRVPVRTWLGASVLAGPARGERAAVATRRTALLPADESQDGTGLQELMARETEALRAHAAHPDVHTAVLAVDPQSWQSVRLTLWREGAEPVDAAETDRYAVPHVSAPELELLGV